MASRQTAAFPARMRLADLSIPIDSAFYLNTAGFVTTVNINGGIPLPAGTYRFFCVRHDLDHRPLRS